MIVQRWNMKNARAGMCGCTYLSSVVLKTTVLSKCHKNRHSQQINNDETFNFHVLFVYSMHSSMLCSLHRPLDETSHKRALATAKRRIREDFMFVGILEQFEDSLTMLEKLLPRYFKGAVDVWKGDCKWRL